jgi:large subunit ribosomal protein L34
MKRTYQPKKIRTLRKRGFLSKMQTVGGRNLLKRRRLKGRSILTVSDVFRIKNKKPKNRNK